MTTTNKLTEESTHSSGHFSSEPPFSGAVIDSHPSGGASQLCGTENAKDEWIYEHDDERTSPSASDSDVAREELGEEPRSIILAMLSQVTKGMDLHRIAFPTFVLEPRSMLERITDFMTHPQLILRYGTSI